MSKKIKLIAIAAVVIIFGSIGAGFYVMLDKMSSLEAIVQTVIPEEEESGEDGEGTTKTESAIGKIFDLDSFVVNLADEQSRFMRVSLNLEYKPDYDAEIIEERLPQIKDAILTYLPSKRSDEISNIAGKEELRADLIAKINGFYGKDIVTNMYFTEFVIQ